MDNATAQPSFLAEFGAFLKDQIIHPPGYARRCFIIGWYLPHIFSLLLFICTRLGIYVGSPAPYVKGYLNFWAGPLFKRFCKEYFDTPGTYLSAPAEWTLIILPFVLVSVVLLILPSKSQDDQLCASLRSAVAEAARGTAKVEYLATKREKLELAGWQHESFLVNELRQQVQQQLDTHQKVISGLQAEIDSLRRQAPERPE